VPDLIKLEPGRTKLYLGCEDDEVDGSPQEFTWQWIKQATKLRVKDRFKKHVEDGHFGEAREAGGGKYYLAEGHRDICRFNNKRFGARKDTIISMDDYEDIICGRKPKGGAVMVRGVEYRGKATLKNFDSDEFFILPRYTPAQCKAMALERIEADIKGKVVPWHDADPASYEYQTNFNIRYSGFYDILRKEMVLVAKRGASRQQIDDAIDLPTSILALITRKLSPAKADYYAARMMEYIETNSKALSNPSIRYKVHQTILEEINIEHLRDLQRLHGDNVDASTEKALNDALKRHKDLLPLAVLSDAPPEQGMSELAPPTKNNGAGKQASDDLNEDGMS
jgi:hypothetical protein